MKKKAFPVSMVFLWSMVFSQAMHSITLGICMGLLMGIAFGLLDSDREELNVYREKEKEEKQKEVKK